MMRGGYGLREWEPKQRPRRAVGEENKDEDKTRLGRVNQSLCGVFNAGIFFFLIDLKALRLTNRKTKKGLEEK